MKGFRETNKLNSSPGNGKYMQCLHIEGRVGILQFESASEVVLACL